LPDLIVSTESLTGSHYRPLAVWSDEVEKAFDVVGSKCLCERLNEIGFGNWSWLRLRKQVLFRTAKGREIHVFVKSVELAVLDAHSDAYRYRYLRPRWRRPGNGAVLRHDATMKVFNAHLLFAGVDLFELLGEVFNVLLTIHSSFNLSAL
jgi:hypothetical protein